MKIKVEMYGLAPYTEANSVDVEVKNGAGIEEILNTILQKIPALEGHVIQTGVNRLTETYGMYVNGRFIGQDEHIEIKPDDRIVLILLAIGG